jgi:PAS domain S-box-containing protein
VKNISKKAKSFVTSLQQLEGGHDFLSSQVPLVVSVIKKDGTIIYQSVTIKNILGYEANARIGKNFLKSKFIHPDDISVKEQLWEKAIKNPNTNFTGEVRLLHKDGTWRWMEVIFNNQLAKPSVTGIVIFSYDISQRKRLEIQKNEFLSIVSHELKTPITTIRAYGQLVSSRLAKDKDKQQEAMFADKIVAQTDKLTFMINELLDASKLQEGKLSVQMDAFQMQQLIERILEDFQYISDKHTVKFFYRTKAFVLGDENRIRQVIENLLTNAVKYSPQSTSICITLERKGKEVITAVQDDGEGIPASKQRYVFDRYFRLQEKNVTQISSGLGLYIASEIIKLHNGRIWLESKKGKGSIFYFSLPVAPKIEA